MTDVKAFFLREYMMGESKLKTVKLGDRDVPIIDGGFFDKYRMEPNLAEIASLPGVADVDFFTGQPKTPVAFEGVEFMMPCFYYDVGFFQAVFVAKLDKLRELLPTRKLEPVRIMPGYGLVALTALSYRLCDIDPYEEFAITVLVKKPGRLMVGALGLVWDQLHKESWGFVWKLPVTTELAWLGGKLGYNYPKYVTDLPYEESGGTITSSICHEGKPEVTIVGRTLRTGGERLLVNHAMSFKDGAVIDIPVRVRALSFATSRSQRACRLELGDGPTADVLRGLGIGRMVQYDYAPQAQVILPAGTEIC